MHSLFLVMIAAVLGSSVAHHNGWYSTREIYDDDEENLELSSCTLSKKLSDKNCDYGTFINKICGHRQDCLQGPGEACTETMEEDTFGLKCAEGFYCYKDHAKCVGLSVDVDINHLIFSPLWESKYA